MRLAKWLGILLLALCAMTWASGNKLGIHEVSRITFDTPVKIGNDVLPAGSYIIRHTMQGEEHIMAFERVGHKEAIRVKCTLVPLDKKAENDKASYEMTSSNEKVLHELVFRGDTAKHVF